MELKEKYNIQIKPRKHKKFLGDSILPIYIIDFDNKNCSYEQVKKYNLNNSTAKK